MKVTTLENVAGRLVEETLGVVRGAVLWSRGLKKFNRGGIRAMEYMTNEDVAEGLNQARTDAEKSLIRQATALGADAIVGLRIEIIEMGAGMYQASAMGTAVRTSELTAAGVPAFARRFELSFGKPANDTAEIIAFPQRRMAGGNAELRTA
ncbi:MAG: YbjQ family protein [Proteobacteria bacterium]|nr:YbjQ family protein [Pseudomonadota bacterium]